LALLRQTAQAPGCVQGAELSEHEIADLAERTGAENNGGLGYTFSDLTLRLIPEAIAACFPDKKLDYAALVDTIRKAAPSAPLTDRHVNYRPLQKGELPSAVTDL
jgi:hypothetical protein